MAADRVECGACGGMQVGPEVKPPESFEALSSTPLTPLAHSLNVYDEFELTPDKIATLQRKDPGVGVVLGEDGQWSREDGAPVEFKSGDIIFCVASPDKEMVATLYHSLSRAATEYARSLTLVDEAVCRYSPSEEANSPLLCVSHDMFSVGFRPDRMSSDDLRCLLAECPFVMHSS